MAKRRRFTRNHWERLISEQPTSGLNITAFCRTKGISQNSFYLWRRRLAKEPKPQQTDSPFISVEVIGTKHFESDLPCGATLRVPSDESSLNLALSVLLRLGGQQ